MFILDDLFETLLLSSNEQLVMLVLPLIVEYDSTAIVAVKVPLLL